MTVAAWQMRIQELLDEGFIDLLCGQPTPCHPVGEVRPSAQGLLNAAISVAPTFQLRLERINVGQQRAIK